MPRCSRIGLSFCALTLMTVLLAGCASDQSVGVPPGTRHESTADVGRAVSSGAPAEPFVIEVAGDRFDYDTAAKMCQSILVADVTVGNLGPSHWNTSDAARPADLTRRTLWSKGYQIVTPISFSQMNILLDQRNKPTTEFATLGGQVGQDAYRWDGVPILRPGGHYLMAFGTGVDVQSGGLSTALLRAHNAFPIDTQQMVLLKPRTTEQGRVSPEVTVSLSAITQQLASCPR